MLLSLLVLVASAADHTVCAGTSATLADGVSVVLCDYPDPRQAAEAALDGDRILIYGGTYTSDVLVDNQTLTFEGVPALASSEVIWKSSGTQALEARSNADVTVRNLTFDVNGAKAVKSFASLSDSSPTVLLEGVTIVDTVGSPLRGAALDVWHGDFTMRNGAVSQLGDPLATPISMISSSNLTMEDVHLDTLQGRTGVISHASNGSLSLTDVTVTSPVSSDDGGAIWMGTGGSTTLVRTTMTQAVSGGRGGAIFLSGSTLDAVDLVLNGGSATDGGLIYSLNSNLVLGGTQLSNAQMKSGVATGLGGNVYVGGGTAQLTDVMLRAGSASDGGLLYNSGGAVTCTRCSLQGTQVGTGVVAAGASSLTLINGSADANNAAGGCGVLRAEADATVSVTGTLFTNNSGTTNPGGAVCLETGAGTKHLTEANFISNSASDGGAVDIGYQSAGEVLITDCTFQGNSASGGGGSRGQGGAIRAVTQTDVVFRIRNSVFTDNTAVTGGAAHLSGTTDVHSHVLACGNRATGQGGAFAAEGAGTDLQLHNSVLWNNAADGGGSIYVADGIANLQHLLLAHSAPGDLSGQTVDGVALLTSGADINLEFSSVIQHAEGVAIYERNGTGVALDRIHVWNNALGDAGGRYTLGADVVTGDPGYGGLTFPGSCTLLDWTFGQTSILHDPSTAGEDLDGSVADYGPTGGLDPFLPAGGSTVDADGDGFTLDTDCDDGNDAVYPGAVEYCATAGVDDDCDGAMDEGSAVDATTMYTDDDLDGYGVISVTACPLDGLSTVGGDCDDTSGAIYPGADERCSTVGVDDDCDNSVDEGSAVDATGYYVDLDGDGFGEEIMYSCTQTTGLVTQGGDCDETSSSAFPGGVERCDDLNVDEDCDGFADDLDPDDTPAGVRTWFPDDDGDGYGAVSSDPTQSCDDPGDGSVELSGDCDDGDHTISPGADEVCDGADNDCDGTIDVDAVDALEWAVDTDLDGYGDPSTTELDCAERPGLVNDTSDCDDSLNWVYPGAEDAPYDGVDADCAGDSDYDADGDGSESDQYGGDDCDDANASVHPNATDVPNDGVDNDCGAGEASSYVGGTCGCSATSTPVSWAFGVVPLLLLRRRSAA